MSGVNPAIGGIVKIVDDHMGVPNAEIRIELVRLSAMSSPSVSSKYQMSGARGDDAILVENEAINQLDIICENLFRIHSAVAVSVVQDADPIQWIPVVNARLE